MISLFFHNFELDIKYLCLAFIRRFLGKRSRSLKYGTFFDIKHFRHQSNVLSFLTGYKSIFS